MAIKSPEQIEKMRGAGRLTAKVLEALSDVICPGMTTMDIDVFCEKYILDTLNAIPGSKGQYGYPYSVNTSLNHVICHGMPSAKQVLKKGDIVNVDVTVISDGYFGDSSKMFCIGGVAAHAQVMHYGKPGMGLTLQEGMVFTIEPMINQGTADVRHLEKDGWSIAVTKDRKLSAQWEHTILVTKAGFEVLTLRQEEIGYFPSL